MLLKLNAITLSGAVNPLEIALVIIKRINNTTKEYKRLFDLLELNSFILTICMNSGMVIVFLLILFSP
jgi:hypothetical protein